MARRGDGARNAVARPRGWAAALVLLLASLTVGRPAHAGDHDGAPAGVAGGPVDSGKREDGPSASGGAPGVPAGGAAEAWKDPYPTMPADNDPTFVGVKWHPGPMVGDKQLEYMAQVPSGDTTNMPLIVRGGGYDDNLMLHQSLYSRALVVFIGPSDPNNRGEAHNVWLNELRDARGPDCSPRCPSWKFVPATAIRDVLDDFARHARFAHDRVQMFGNIFTRYDIYRALDPLLQPYFAGVAHGIYAEWRQATCPDAAKPTASPPRIFFSWGRCDASFCPTMECMNTLKSEGYAIEPSSKGDTTLELCPCPGGQRPHILPARPETSEATYDWLLSNVRK